MQSCQSRIKIYKLVKTFSAKVLIECLKSIRPSNKKKAIPGKKSSSHRRAAHCCLYWFSRPYSHKILTPGSALSWSPALDLAASHYLRASTIFDRHPCVIMPCLAVSSPKDPSAPFCSHTKGSCQKTYKQACRHTLRYNWIASKCTVPRKGVCVCPCR